MRQGDRTFGVIHFFYHRFTHGVADKGRWIGSVFAVLAMICLRQKPQWKGKDCSYQYFLDQVWHIGLKKRWLVGGWHSGHSVAVATPQIAVGKITFLLSWIAMHDHDAECFNSRSPWKEGVNYPGLKAEA